MRLFMLNGVIAVGYALAFLVARRVHKSCSCSLSVVFVQQAAKPVAAVHTAPILADDGWTVR